MGVASKEGPPVSFQALQVLLFSLWHSPTAMASS